MKHFLSNIMASIIGGAIVLGSIYLSNNTFSKTAPAQNEGFAKSINHVNVSPTTTMVPENFRVGAKKAMPVVVHISSIASNKESDKDPLSYFFDDNPFNPFRDRGPRQGTGSGVIYTQDGYIVTNNHVIEFADKIEVTLYDNRKFIAEVVGREEKTDLAVIKIEGQDLPILDFANSDEVEVGDWVLAVGNPFDLTSTVTAGIISAKGRDINLLGSSTSIEAFLQTDAVVNPGNSGGALVTADGQLLGINTAIATRTGVFSGYSFAIPVNLVTRIVDDIINTGAYQRAYLGVHIYELDSEAAKALGVDITQGVVIDELEDGGSAQFAGLLPKDIIIQVNDKTIRAVPELQELVGTAKVGDVMNVTVNRKGEEMKIPVLLRAEQ